MSKNNERKNTATSKAGERKKNAANKTNERRNAAISKDNERMDYADEMTIHWFPGHMTKARRNIAEDIKLVDAVVELLDARIPRSSANPDMDELTNSKPRLVILNRADLADQSATKRWSEYFRAQGRGVITTDCRQGKGVDRFQPAIRELLAELLAGRAERGQVGKPIRLMVAGIPNVGKSTFINRIAGRRATTVSDRPGVTRGKQWINCGNGIELLDTPGILWPKFEDKRTGENLAITGAVKDDVIDIELLGTRLLLMLWENYRDGLTERYKLKPDDEPDEEFPLELIAKRRGFLMSGAVPDTRRAAIMLLDEFRGGKLGRITLEFPQQSQELPVRAEEQQEDI